MPFENIEVAASNPLIKALSENSTSGSFAMLLPQGQDPSGDGVFDIGEGGMYAPQHAFIVPYVFGPPESNFSMRVYGWRVLGNDPLSQVWVPLLLIELACTSCVSTVSLTSYAGRGMRLLPDGTNFCDTLVVVNGTAGPEDGEVMSQPGTDLIGWALIELRGCQKIQFDFDQTDPVEMNALWARG